MPKQIRQYQNDGTPPVFASGGDAEAFFDVLHVVCNVVGVNPSGAPVVGVADKSAYGHAAEDLFGKEFGGYTDDGISLGVAKAGRLRKDFGEDGQAVLISRFLVEALSPHLHDLIEDRTIYIAELPLAAQRALYVIAHEFAHCRDYTQRNREALPQKMTNLVADLVPHQVESLLDELVAAHFSAGFVTGELFSLESKEVLAAALDYIGKLNQLTSQNAGDSSKYFMLSVEAMHATWNVLRRYTCLEAFRQANRKLSSQEMLFWNPHPFRGAAFAPKLRAFVTEAMASYPDSLTGGDALLGVWRAICDDMGVRFLETPEGPAFFWDTPTMTWALMSRLDVPM